MSSNSVERAIDHFLAELPSQQKIVVAFSGGKDSIALLHCLAQKAEKYRLTAIYINHQLQVESDSWGSFCSKFCQENGIAFEELKVKIEAKHRKGIEAVARERRYEALFGQVLKQADAALVTAHHAQDQTETVLLNVIRGTGLFGLRAMSYLKVWHVEKEAIEHYRPLLTVELQAIKDYLLENNLSWIEDPSNQENQFSRNYIRNQLLPNIYNKWPKFDEAIARLSGNASEAVELLQEIGEQDLSRVESSSFSLDLSAMAGESWARQKNLIIYWLLKQQQKTELNQTIYQWLKEVLSLNNPNAHPKRMLSNHSEIRVEGKKIYFLVNFKESYRLGYIPESFEFLHFDEKSMLNHQVAERWLESPVVFRSIELDDFEKTPGLKKWLNNNQIVYWNRHRWPVIEIEGEIAAVLGYSTNEKFKR